MDIFEALVAVDAVESMLDRRDSGSDADTSASVASSVAASAARLDEGAGAIRRLMLEEDCESLSDDPLLLGVDSEGALPVHDVRNADPDNNEATVAYLHHPLSSYRTWS